MHPHAVGHAIALVGGGDLVRADYLTIAQDRLNVPSARRSTKVNLLRGRLASAGLARGAGPWLPAAGWGKHTRVGLVSTGVHPLPAEQRVREALAKVDFAYVRTHEAADRLAAAGMSSDRVLVAPDMIFAHPWLNEPEALRAEVTTSP
ncbi:hypothetical protein BJF81_15805 [Ornithinimicrobium sp. CNJ-824]|nr:hypothetical protein BJF81_15805 [Ornithinimicrobium sp. CNJ-824]